jgi:hypothetical protein
MINIKFEIIKKNKQLTNINVYFFFDNHFLFSKITPASLGRFIGPTTFGPSILPLSVRKL